LRATVGCAGEHIISPSRFELPGALKKRKERMMNTTFNIIGALIIFGKWSPAMGRLAQALNSAARSKHQSHKTAFF